MAVNIKGRSFLTLKDFSGEEIRYLLDLARDLKSKKRAGIVGEALKGKNIVLMFDKTSTRTRCSFEVAARDEGAGVTFLDKNSSQVGKKESIEDSARVLGRFFDGIEYRGYDQSLVEDLAKYSGIPVWNGLTDVDHPTQALADVMTLMENTTKPLDKCKIVFCGDTRNNVAYCLMYICCKLGIDYYGWGPAELAPAQDVLDYGEGDRLAHRIRQRYCRGEGRGCAVYGHMGLHGRGGQDPGARGASYAVPRDDGRSARDGKSALHLPALPALLP